MIESWLTIKERKTCWQEGKKKDVLGHGYAPSYDKCCIFLFVAGVACIVLVALRCIDGVLTKWPTCCSSLMAHHNVKIFTQNQWYFRKWQQCGMLQNIQKFQQQYKILRTNPDLFFIEIQQAIEGTNLLLSRNKSKVIFLAQIQTGSIENKSFTARPS